MAENCIERNNMNWKKWAKAAAIRAVKTLAQALLGGIAVGMAMSDIDWKHLISVAIVATIISLLTSLAGLPELEQEGVAAIGAERTDADRRDDSEEKKDA